MTTELEKQFFNMFGIEKIECCKHFKYYDSKCDRLNSTEKCLDCIGTNKIYPKITDRRLLNMICLIADICNYSGDVFDIEQNSINELKKFILHFLINYMKTEHTNTFYKNDEVKICVQQLFKEEE